MGSSRSWAADMEDEETTCKYGVVTKYFDTCRCEGCNSDRRLWAEVQIKADSVRSKAVDLFSKTPKEDWGKIVSIRIK